MTLATEICSLALIKLGEGIIEDFVGSDKAIICGKAYPNFKDYVLSLHNWRFALKRTELNLTKIEDGNFYYSSMPNDMLTLVQIYNQSSSPLNDYKRFGQQIISNGAVSKIDYISKISESNWPSWYQELFVTALAAELALPITGDEQLEQIFWYKAWGPKQLQGDGGLFRIAKRIDAKQQPLAQINNFPLFEARRK